MDKTPTKGNGNCSCAAKKVCAKPGVNKPMPGKGKEKRNVK